jgi:hypothetical protein
MTIIGKPSFALSCTAMHVSNSLGHMSSAGAALAPLYDTVTSIVRLLTIITMQ